MTVIKKINKPKRIEKKHVRVRAENRNGVKGERQTESTAF